MEPAVKQPLFHLLNWQPFRIDALGLITLLGASELDIAIGQLFFPSTTEFAPLLAPFIISNNSFTKPIPGVTLYNITDGIVATDVSGWVVRWLMSRDLGWNSATLIISVGSFFRVEDRRTQRKSKCWEATENVYIAWWAQVLRACKAKMNQVLGLIIGTAAMLPIMLMPLLQRDWFGVVNALALLVTIVTRVLLVRLNREAISRSVIEGLRVFDRAREMTKLVVTLPGGKFVTIYCQRGIAIGTLLTAPRPDRVKYSLVLGVSWIALSCHVVSIGMASLVDQMICVSIIVASTIVFVKMGRGGRRDTKGGVVYKINDGHGAMSWHLSKEEEDGRSAAYARLRLSEEEERTMRAWNLFPMKSNEVWWDKYYSRPEHKQNCPGV